MTSAMLPAQASPQIDIGQHFDYVESGKSNLLKRVRNTGSSTAFVEIEVLEIHYDPITDQPVETPLPAMDTSSASTEQLSNRLIASPARLIVPADGMQATRLLYMGKRDQERYYRVRYSPVAAAQTKRFGLDDEEIAEYERTLTAGVSMLFGYGTIVTVRPDEARYDTKLDTSAKQYSIRNLGNSAIILDFFSACDAAGQHCESPAIHRVRPGRMLQLDAAGGKTYQFTLVEGEQKRPIILKGT